MSDYLCFKALEKKEVVNTETGERLGCISDAEIDLDCGQIKYFIVPVCHNAFSLKPSEKRKFSFSDITKIGDDIILIKKSYPCIIHKKVL